MLLLLALVYSRQANTDKALEVLEDAVRLASAGRWIGPFIEAGQEMAVLLNRLFARNIAVDFIAELLDVFRQDSRTGTSADPVPPVKSLAVRPQPLVEKLTNRELDVLELLAMRMYNKEIADKLFVSTETVKTHLTNIYQKLNATKRREAVDIARRLGIIK